MNALTQTAMCMASGRYFDILAPLPDDVTIEDIAHHLSQICRFGGATHRTIQGEKIPVHYSVAQHSVRVADTVETLAKRCGGNIDGSYARFALLALLHDAHEAYMGDVISPHKHLFGEYVELANSVQAAILAAFNLEPPNENEAKSIENADRQECYESWCNFMSGEYPDARPIYIDAPAISPLSACQAKAAFLDRFKLFSSAMRRVA